jgi:heterodisulfide reductase subunit C
LSKHIEEKKSGKPDKFISTLKILEELKTITAPCFQCTTCASACPAFQSDRNRNPRLIVRRLQSGAYHHIFDEIDFWWCGGCYSCETHCPQGVPMTGVLFRLKNLAFNMGYSIPKQIQQAGEALKTGFLLPLTNAVNDKRKQLGLPDLKKPAVEEINTILDGTGFLDRLKKL